MIRIALTFDDGPAKWTHGILDALEHADAHATFFVCGHAVRDHPPAIRRMINSGHELGVHTMTHPHLTHLDARKVRQEICSTIVLLNYAGIEPVLWRAPYLDLNDKVLAIAAEEGLTHVGIDIAPPDFRLRCDQIVAAVGEPENGQIIGLHDGIPPDGGTGEPDRVETVKAVRRILGMQADFVTVSALWGS